MSLYFSVYVYFGLVLLVTLMTLGVSGLLPSRKTEKAKFLPYESGIITETALLKKRFPLHHFLAALVFLIFDVEIIFLYPWAVVGKSMGLFAFFELLFFIGVLMIGFVYAWRKGGLQWE